MTDPSYRETPEAPLDRLLFGACAARSHVPATVVHHAAVEGDCECACHVANPVRPLPDWMPTPEELDAWNAQIPFRHLTYENEALLLEAVRWLLEERKNR